MQCLANYSRLLSLRDTSAVLLFKVAELLCIQKSSSDQIRGKEHSFQLITSYLADREIYEWYRRSLRIRVYEIFVRQLRNSEIFMRISLAVFGNEKLRVHRQGRPWQKGHMNLPSLCSWISVPSRLNFPN